MPTNVATTQVWTLQNVDTARVGRYHDGAFLLQGGSTSNASHRQGVIPAVFDNVTLVMSELQVKAQTVNSLSCDVSAGNAIVNRSGQGPYAVMFTGVSTITFDAAHATLPRIDRVDLVINDAALGDVGTNATITITTGTAAASPTVPADPAPGRSIPLATVTRPANDNTIAQGDIADTRKSTGLLGGTRILLAGDSLTDPGFVVGERTNTLFKDGSSGGRIREWDGSSWRDVDAWMPAARGFRYVKNATQSIPHNVDTEVAFQSSSAAAGGIAASPHVTVSGTGNTRFTLNREGWWSVATSVSWATSALGAQQRVFIRDYTTGFTIGGSRSIMDGNADTINASGHVYVTLGAPRQIGVMVWQFNGSSAAIDLIPQTGINDDCSFSAVWIGK